MIGIKSAGIVRCAICKTSCDVTIISPWINVKERLPEKGQDVLIFDPRLEKEDQIQLVIFDSQDVWSRGGWHDETVYFKPTHWMPLPEPPKEEK